MASIYEAKHHQLLDRFGLIKLYHKYRSIFTKLAAVSYLFVQNALSMVHSKTSVNPVKMPNQLVIDQSDLIDQLSSDLLGSCVYANILTDANLILTIPHRPQIDNDIRDALARKILDHEWTGILKIV